MKNHAKKWICAAILFLLLVHIAYKIPAPCEWLSYEWEAGELITFVGTITLGYLAYWQNQNFKNLTEKQDAKKMAIDKYPLISFESLDIRACFIEDYGPWKIVDTKTIDSCDGKNYFEIFVDDNIETITLKFQVKNIGEFLAANMYVRNKDEKCVNYNPCDDEGDPIQKSYLFPNEIGWLSFDYEQVHVPSEQELYLEYINPFQSKYYQKIAISNEGTKITIQTDLFLNINVD